MRIAVISDSHTKDNINFIYEYLKTKPLNLDSVVINGDLLGTNRITKGYGNESDPLFNDSLDRAAIFKSIAPKSSEKIMSIVMQYNDGILIDDAKKEELGKEVCNFLEERYDFVLNTLAKFSTIAKTFFNFGDYESPLNNKILEEISFLLKADPGLIKKCLLYSPYRSIFQRFLGKLKQMEGKKFKYLAWNTTLEKGYLLAGIPGMNASSVPLDPNSELQEKLTTDLLNTITRMLSYSKKLIIFNHVDSKINEKPFMYKPGSRTIREFMKSKKAKQLVFVQSHNHWITTHFFASQGTHFILNNAAVNNCLFNIIEAGPKLRCFDVDPKIDLITELKLYDSYVSDYSSPRERLNLNYPNSGEIINKRKLEGYAFM